MHLHSSAVPTWRSLDDAADQVGVTKRTLQKWIRAGLLKPYRIMGDRRTFVDLDQIAELRKPKPRPPRKPPSEKARTADGRPVMVAAVIPHPEGPAEVLMTARVRAAVRVWSWVGGHVHAGETAEAAVIRELTEELEVDDPRVVRLLGRVDTHTDA